MDNREQLLKAFAEDILISKDLDTRDKLRALIDRDLSLNKDNLFFKSEDAAMNFLLEQAKELGDDGYIEYKKFFKAYLNHAKRDIISGLFVEKDDGIWQDVKVKLEAIKSYAQGTGLKAHQVRMHLDRFINSRPKEMLVEIPKWDGRDRVEELRLFIKIKNQEFSVFEDAIKEWGANVFRRLYQDGAQNRCIILKGAQGIGKDHLLKSLLQGFGAYYSKFSSNRDEREAWAQVTGSLVLHIEEFDQTGNMSTAFLKDLITRDWVTYRMPYEPAAKKKKCVGSFISTVNIDTILRDETGNRRFAVFELDAIDWRYPKDWSEQILAQFYWLYQNHYYANKETWLAVSQGNETYEAVDMGPELLSLWDKKVSGMAISFMKKEFNYGEISHVISEMAKHVGWKPRTICSVLKTSGRSRHTKSGRVYYANASG